MVYSTYALLFKDGDIYKGVTSNLAKRLDYHHRGLSRWTRDKGTFRLIYSKDHRDKKEALKVEKFLKTGKGREFLKNISSGCGSVG